jgi:hypothetical protein
MKKKRKKPKPHGDPNRLAQWIIVPDVHASVSGEHDGDSLATVERFMQSKRFDGYLNLGDLCDFGIISTHNANRLREIEGGRIMDEYKIANDILSRHESIVRTNNPNAEMVLLEGNHDYRIERYMDAHPELSGMLEVEKVLRLRERGIQYVKSWSEGKIFELGRCWFSHGLFCNEHHAKKMLQRFNHSIAYGHTHDLQMYSSHAYRPQDVLIAASLGCLCRIPQRWCRGAPTKWSQAVTEFQFDKVSGQFQFNILRLIDHKLIHDGKVYQ